MKTTRKQEVTYTVTMSAEEIVTTRTIMRRIISLEGSNYLDFGPNTYPTVIQVARNWLESSEAWTVQVTPD